MIHRKFDGFKFGRTYIGGSKKTESKAFMAVQGTKEDNSDCDWMEYRRLLTRYLDDVLHVLVSWVHLTHTLSIIFAIIALFALYYSPLIGLIIFTISLITHLVSKFLSKKEKEMLMAYNFSMDIILKEIKTQTGFILSKN